MSAVQSHLRVGVSSVFQVFSLRRRHGCLCDLHVGEPELNVDTRHVSFDALKPEEHHVDRVNVLQHQPASDQLPLVQTIHDVSL